MHLDTASAEVSRQNFDLTNEQGVSRAETWYLRDLDF